MSDHAPAIPYAAELGRKALHLGALVIPFTMLLIGRERSVAILVPLALFGTAWDLARLRWRWLYDATDRLFGPIMRPEERPAFGAPFRLNGATWMCLSAALCALLFPLPIAAAALVMLMVGDGAAAVVGRKFGRTHYPGSPKSAEGSAAFFATALLAAWPLTWWPAPGLGVWVLVGGAAVAAVAEAVPFPVNDNLRVPLIAGGAMVLLAGVL
jgi:dolichol kinase